MRLRISPFKNNKWCYYDIQIIGNTEVWILIVGESENQSKNGVCMKRNILLTLKEIRP